MVISKVIGRTLSTPPRGLHHGKLHLFHPTPSSNSFLHTEHAFAALLPSKFVVEVKASDNLTSIEVAI